MNILIIDQDALSTQLIKSKLEVFGHQITHVFKRDEGMQELEQRDYDVIFVDPSPATNIQPFVVNARRISRQYHYIILLGQSGTQSDAIKAGCNDILVKPLDTPALEKKVENAERMVGMIRHIGDTSEDFPSAGGVIAKSAFNQLFLSGMDRAQRYGECNYVLFITLMNYQELLELDGKQAATYAAAELSQKLVHTRRQSDIAGQIREYEYALLLQRPTKENEPVEAAARIAEALSDTKSLSFNGNSKVSLRVRLVDKPIGSIVAEHVMH